MAQHATLAPWAEEIPGAAYPMTVDDLLRLSEQASTAGQTGQYELVDGRLIRVPGSGGEASLIAVRLTVALSLFAQPRKLGQITGSDGTFDLTQPGDATETALVPDVAYIQASRIPPRGSDEYKRAWRLAPDLVAEVASPNQYRPEMFSKMQRYLAAGVRLVWVIWPGSQQVDVWRPPVPTVDQPMMRLRLGAALDGLDVLPGFIYALDELFA
jgi:Uma2 family endonuclease